MIQVPGPRRVVHHADALSWLRTCGQLSNASVITSLPDASEVPALGLEGWERWFEEAALLTMTAVPDEGVAIFFQSDIMHAGKWIDKSMPLMRAAKGARLALLFHSIVCRKQPGTVSWGRPSYSHLLGFQGLGRSWKKPRTDVLPDAGFMAGSKAMGASACLYACQFVINETSTRTIVDPFCGWGTALAVANALGLDAVGVDQSARKCRRAEALRLELAPNGVVVPAGRR